MKGKDSKEQQPQPWSPKLPGPVNRLKRLRRAWQGAAQRSPSGNTALCWAARADPKQNLPFLLLVAFVNKRSHTASDLHCQMLLQIFEFRISDFNLLFKSSIFEFISSRVSTNPITTMISFWWGFANEVFAHLILSCFCNQTLVVEWLSWKSLPSSVNTQTLRFVLAKIKKLYHLLDSMVCAQMRAVVSK